MSSFLVVIHVAGHAHGYGLHTGFAAAQPMSQSMLCRQSETESHLHSYPRHSKGTGHHSSFPSRHLHLQAQYKTSACSTALAASSAVHVQCSAVQCATGKRPAWLHGAMAAVFKYGETHERRGSVCMLDQLSGDVNAEGHMLAHQKTCPW